MSSWLLLALALAAAPARAQRIVFVPTYASAVGRALAADPLFASRLLKRLDLHAERLRQLPPRVSLEFLRAEIEEEGGIRSLERLSPRAASALLTANALARPDQFRELLPLLERLRPGLGDRAAERIAEGVRPYRRVHARIEAARLSAASEPATGYDARGRLQRFFDGSPGPDPLQ